MDRRYIKLKIKSLIRSIMFGSYYNIKKKEYPKINKIISEVQKYGISQIQDHFTENDLKIITKNFNLEMENKITNERNQCQIEDEDFIKNDVLKKFFLDEKFYKKLANNYLNGAPCRRAVGGKRIFPMESKNFANYQWHHDDKIKSFKFYLLLSDMNENGQKTEYLTKTHKLFNTPKNKIFNDNDPILSKYEKKAMTGKRGTCYFFDGNGIHRGNRNESYIRDTIIIEFQLI